MVEQVRFLETLTTGEKFKAYMEVENLFKKQIKNADWLYEKSQENFLSTLESPNEHEKIDALLHLATARANVIETYQNYAEFMNKVGVKKFKVEIELPNLEDVR